MNGKPQIDGAFQKAGREGIPLRKAIRSLCVNAGSREGDAHSQEDVEGKDPKAEESRSPAHLEVS